MYNSPNIKNAYLYGDFKAGLASGLTRKCSCLAKYLPSFCFVIVTKGKPIWSVHVSITFFTLIDAPYMGKNVRLCNEYTVEPPRADLASSAWRGAGFPRGGARGSLTGCSYVQSATLLSQHLPFCYVLHYLLFIKFTFGFYHVCVTQGSKKRAANGQKQAIF